LIYRSTLLLESPLSVTRRRATGNDLESLEYIPGTTVRGALAEAYRKEHGIDDVFQKLFLGGEPIRFCDYRIEGADPWPLSARICQSQGQKHPTQDLLLAEAVRKECDRDCTALGCGVKLTRPDGYYRNKVKEGHTKPAYWQEDVDSRRVAHVQMDPQLLRAKTGQFYSERSLEARQTFFGRIVTAGENDESLGALVGARKHLYIGRARSRGRGRALLTMQPDEPEAGELASRIRQFNDLAGARFSELKDWLLFSCTLLSPAFVLDDWLLSRSWLAPADLGLHGYTLLSWFSEMREIGGWHAAARLPKADMPALAPGSCFLFAKPRAAASDAEYGVLAETAARLERDGIGERRQEGFGELSCCHLFHARPQGEEA
jgi:CRISPR-associated protein Csx10